MLLARLKHDKNTGDAEDETASKCPHISNISCLHCQHKMLIIGLDAHIEEAHAYVSVECIHCGKVQVASHRATCDAAPVSCPHSILGCSETMARGSLQEHVTTCLFAKLAPALGGLTAQVCALTNENKRLVTMVENTCNLVPPVDRIEVDFIQNKLEHLNQRLNALESPTPHDIVMGELIRLKEEMAIMKSHVGHAILQLQWIEQRVRDRTGLLGSSAVRSNGAGPGRGGKNTGAAAMARDQTTRRYSSQSSDDDVGYSQSRPRRRLSGGLIFCL